MQRTLRCIDGRVATIDSSLNVSESGASSYAQFSTGIGRVGLSTGGADFGADVAARNEIALNQQYTVSGLGPVKVGTVTDNIGEGTGLTISFTIGVWQGANNSVVAHVYESPVSALLDRFRAFNFVEYSDGLQAVPKSGNAITSGHSLPRIFHRITGLGLLDIQATADEGPDSPPNSTPTTTRGGLLYEEESDNQIEGPDAGEVTPEYSLLLVGTTAVTRIDGDRDEMTEAQIHQAATDLAVSFA